MMDAAIAPRRMLLAFLIGLVGVFVLSTVNSCVTSGTDRTDGGDSILTGDDGLPVDLGLDEFSISGSLDVPLKPGLTASLDLQLENPYNEILGIDDLAVTVTSVSAPNATKQLPCTVNDFDTPEVKADVALPALSTSTLSEMGVAAGDLPQVTMLNTSLNQDGCKGATLALRYTATGVQQ